ncbi:MAG: hypothetical protein ACM3UW_07885 [Bacillota bacterium]
MSRQRILLLLAIMGIIAYTSFYFILPLRHRVVMNGQAIRSLTGELELARRLPEGTDQLNRDVQDLQDRLEILNRMVPREVGNAEVIIILTSLADKYNLYQGHISESRDVKPRSAEQNLEARLHCNTFLWKGSGYYKDIKGFLKALEESERLLEISDIKLVKMTEAASVDGSVYDEVESSPATEPRFSVSLHVKTYYDLPGPGAGEDI